MNTNWKSLKAGIKTAEVNKRSKGMSILVRDICGT